MVIDTLAENALASPGLEGPSQEKGLNHSLNCSMQFYCSNWDPNIHQILPSGPEWENPEQRSVAGWRRRGEWNIKRKKDSLVVEGSDCALPTVEIGRRK